MTDQRCLTSAIARRNAMTAGHRAPTNDLDMRNAAMCDIHIKKKFNEN
jgi:hypothetical protein